MKETIAVGEQGWRIGRGEPKREGALTINLSDSDIIAIFANWQQCVGNA
ncbi:MAG: hypothetical protein IKR83_00920 [Bacteroidales bacterium]|nr:hypothetical protein [Bacteroidales bacterium]